MKNVTLTLAPSVTSVRVPLFWTLLLSLLLIGGAVVGQDQPTQQRNVQGIVLDDESQPLVAANVYVKGTSIGTATDAEGKFSISVASDAVLVFSFIGFKTQEIAVTSDLPENITVKLELFDNITGEPLVYTVDKRPKR